MVIGPLALPATVIFLGLMVGGILLVISWLLWGGAEEADRQDDGVSTACRRCSHVNPTHARFCAHCGCSLG